MLGNIYAQYENIMNIYSKMVCGTRLVFFVCRGWYAVPPWLSKRVVGGWSWGPASSIFVARAVPVGISDVLWQRSGPWSFNPDVLNSGPTSSACVARVAARSKSGCFCPVAVACHCFLWRSLKERGHAAVSLNRDQLRLRVHIGPTLVALYMMHFIEREFARFGLGAA